MILFKKTMNSICAENCIMLEVEDVGFVYMSKSAFEQALLIADRFEGDIIQVLRKLTSSPRHIDNIQYFNDLAPEPLNMLAPFLTLVKEDVELDNDFELLCGVLHQMSITMDFAQILLVPAEVRVNLDFGWNFVRRYKSNWEAIEMKLKVSEVDIETIKLSAIEAILKRVMPLIGITQQSTFSTIEQVGVNTSGATPPVDKVVSVPSNSPSSSNSSSSAGFDFGGDDFEDLLVGFEEEDKKLKSSKGSNKESHKSETKVEEKKEQVNKVSQSVDKNESEEIEDIIGKLAGGIV